MEKDGCGSSRIWKTFSDVPLGYVFFSVYFWGCLQVVCCAVLDCCSTYVDWFLVPF